VVLAPALSRRVEVVVDAGLVLIVLAFFGLAWGFVRLAAGMGGDRR